MGSLALRPGDLLTILTMALSIGYRSSVSFLSAIQATGFLTFSPVGLSPTEHASLSWTYTFRLFKSTRMVDRDRGMPRGSAPPTPPDMRVRIRRFGGLSDWLHS